MLITRPLDDGAPLAQVLGERGHTSVLSPLLEIDPCPNARGTCDAARAIAFTSRNALKVVSGWPEFDRLKRLKVFCVGPKTAELARDLGFSEVAGWSPTAETLASDMAEVLGRAEVMPESPSGPIVHFAGADVAGDLVGSLSNHGFDAKKVVVYRAGAAKALTQDAVSALNAGQIDGVLLYSPRTAKVFCNLIGRAELQNTLNNVHACCLSDNVATSLGDMRGAFARVAVAEKPNGKEMLALIDRMAAQLRP
ncbi:MAG: uroporphyrinogen-III synthase [Pseudomonadota bacterium]